MPFVQFEKRKKNLGGMLMLVKLQDEACSFSENNTPPCFLTFFLNCTNGTKLRKASQI